MIRTLTVAVALLAAPQAFAAPDLEVSVTAPGGGADVYDVVRYSVKVENNGNSHASGTVLQIDLPETRTSPTVHVMGIVGRIHKRCSQQGQSVVCDLGKVRKGRSKTRWFEIAWPVSAAPLTFHAEATTNGDANLADNEIDHTASVNYVATAVGAPRDAHNRHCTGQGLIGFYECTLFPSSIMSHDITFELGGGISFVNAPAGYTGSWSQPAADALVFEYRFDGDVVASFSGFGVGGDCFEGVTTFASPWNAPYEVCLQ